MLLACFVIFLIIISQTACFTYQKLLWHRDKTMTINRYRANSLKSAMEKATAELGPEAKILQVKKIEGFSNDRPEQVEIIAVVDEDIPMIKRNEIEGQSLRSRSDNNVKRNSINMLVNDDLDDDFQSFDRNDNNKKQNKTDKQQARPYRTLTDALRSYSNTTNSDSQKGQSTDAPSIAQKLKDQKIGIGKSEDRSIQNNQSQPKSIYENPKTFSSNLDRISDEPKNRKHLQEIENHSIGSRSRISQILHECLLRNQVNGELSYDILSLLNDEKHESMYDDGEPGIRDYLTYFMENRINISGSLDKSRKVIALIGPTGVGKTTTLAKLAAQYHFQKDKNVGLITIDAYRIAAIDQLKTYAQIMSIPLKVALTPEQLLKCINDYSDMDIVLIDTPGRSHLNIREIKAIEEFLEAAQPADTHLLISASIKDDDALTVVESFAPDYVRKFIFTKLDETASFGLILNLCAKIKKPISYLTMGQNVPDDIKPADIKYLVDLFVTKNRINKPI
jgi:flagellar biosynthesis protein FlhF